MAMIIDIINISIISMITYLNGPWSLVIVLLDINTNDDIYIYILMILDLKLDGWLVIVIILDYYCNIISFGSNIGCISSLV